MSPRTFELVVQPDGQIVIEAIGFSGSDCEKATRFLEESLGQLVTRRKKPEYHKRARTVSAQRIGR